MGRRRKPRGWPRYMEVKRLRAGEAYYWNPPTWARKAGCPLDARALGGEFSNAKAHCDDVLNPQFDAWRLGRSGSLAPLGPLVGSFDWMVSIYKAHPAYQERPAKTQTSYDAALALVSKYTLKNGQDVGSQQINSITPGVVDKLHSALRTVVKDGVQYDRTRTALLSMQVCRRAWKIAYRVKSSIVPAENPFAKMGLAYKPTPTKPVSHAILMQFVKAADDHGYASLGTAAMIAFYWLQRQEDIVSRLSWSHYRPADRPDVIRVWHYKTGEMVEVPLYDADGTSLWPDLVNRLDRASRHGTLIVTRDKPDRLRKIHLPWQIDTFRHRVAEIRTAAGIDPSNKFMGFRHGGNVEGAEADLTDAQLRALSGHKTTAALLRYAQATERQRRVGARKRLESRTKRGGLSE
ncbi:MAG: site-specific integrase [Proteobacteria bacterium]|jgi:hypothetical protein|nr:site-specific integrase [Pseudomonadota bacterium]